MSEIGTLIAIETELLPAEKAVLLMLARAGGAVIESIKARQAGNPQPAPVLQIGEAAWGAIQQMSNEHAALAKAT